MFRDDTSHETSKVTRHLYGCRCIPCLMVIGIGKDLSLALGNLPKDVSRPENSPVRSTISLSQDFICSSMPSNRRT
jgi:hypothetical protein